MLGTKGGGAAAFRRILPSSSMSTPPNHTQAGGTPTAEPVVGRNTEKGHNLDYPKNLPPASGATAALLHVQGPDVALGGRRIKIVSRTICVSRLDPGVSGALGLESTWVGGGFQVVQRSVVGGGGELSGPNKRQELLQPCSLDGRPTSYFMQIPERLFVRALTMWSDE